MRTDRPLNERGPVSTGFIELLKNVYLRTEEYLIRDGQFKPVRKNKKLLFKFTDLHKRIDSLKILKRTILSFFEKM